MGIMRKSGAGGTIKEQMGRDNSGLSVGKTKTAPYTGAADDVPSGGKVANSDKGYIKSGMSIMEGW